MTMVTAIVSPNARPSPRIIPPMVPERQMEERLLLIISQRVAPRANMAFALLIGHSPYSIPADCRNYWDNHDRKDNTGQPENPPRMAALGKVGDRPNFYQANSQSDFLHRHQYKYSPKTNDYNLGWLPASQ